MLVEGDDRGGERTRKPERCHEEAHPDIGRRLQRWQLDRDVVGELNADSGRLLDDLSVHEHAVSGRRPLSRPVRHDRSLSRNVEAARILDRVAVTDDDRAGPLPAGIGRQLPGGPVGHALGDEHDRLGPLDALPVVGRWNRLEGRIAAPGVRSLVAPSTTVTPPATARMSADRQHRLGTSAVGDRGGGLRRDPAAGRPPDRRRPTPRDDLAAQPSVVRTSSAWSLSWVASTRRARASRPRTVELGMPSSCAIWSTDRSAR